MTEKNRRLKVITADPKTKPQFPENKTCWSDTGQCVNHGACNANDGCMYKPKKGPQ